MPDSPLTLVQAVDFALTNYPAVRASLERVAASREGVSLSRTAYLPRADLLWQSNRATRNNIFGLLLPQSFVPPITGPALSSTSDRGAWGSAASVLLSWEPFDFGYRGATVDVAKAAQNRANASLSLTRLEVAAVVGEAFFALAAAQQQAEAAEADVERRQVLANSVHALVKEQLRPGADSSRADAELAAAKIQLIRAQELGYGLSQSLVHIDYEYHFLYITGIESVESKSIQSVGLLKLTFHPGTGSDWRRQDNRRGHCPRQNATQRVVLSRPA